MEAIQPTELLHAIPPWHVLLRAAPISIWSAALIALGWWARGRCDAEFIAYLKAQKSPP